MKFTLLDGGLGISLHYLGHDIKNDKTFGAGLIKSNPSLLETVHRDFIDAGSDAILTSTYQGSSDLLAAHFNISKEEALSLITESVKFARLCTENVKRNIKIGGSLGPFGAHLCDMSEYSGSYMKTYATSSIKNHFQEMVSAIAKGNPDFIAFETIPSLEEAIIISELMRDEFPQILYYISLSCKNESRTCAGDDILKAFQQLYEEYSSPSFLGIGVNCTAAENILPILKSIKPFVPAGKEIIVYPNAHYNVTSTSGPGPNPILPNIMDWITFGATWIGGCCGVTSSHISEINDFRLLPSK